MRTVAIIGISGYAQCILRVLQQTAESAGARLVAAVVINRNQEEETCRRLESEGCQIYTNYQDMLREWKGRLDLCIIPTSIHWHEPMTRAALAAGANVLVEKPLAGSPEEGAAMIEAAREAGKFIAVGFQDMYSPALWEAKETLLAEPYGPVVSVSIWGSWHRTRDYYSRNDWAGRLTSHGRPVYDSPLNNAFAHFVNVGLFLAGRATGQMAEVSGVSGQLLRFYPIESFDTANVTFHTIGGVPVQVTLTHADREEVSPEVVVTLRHGQLHWIHEQEITLRDAQGKVVQRWELSRGDESRAIMLRDILASLSGTHGPRCPASLALPHVQAIRKLHEDVAIRDGAAAFPELEQNRDGDWMPVPKLFQQLRESSPSGAEIVAA